MAAKVKSAEKALDRCELCGRTVEDAFVARMGHLRRSHTRYARGLLLRMSAPFVFLLGMVVAGAMGAPQPVFLGVLIVSFGMLFFGKQISRLARAHEGARPTLPLLRLVREGGLWFLLIVPVLAVLVFLAGRM